MALMHLSKLRILRRNSNQKAEHDVAYITNIIMNHIIYKLRKSFAQNSEIWPIRTIDNKFDNNNNN